jgi:hypothetical protein
VLCRGLWRFEAIFMSDEINWREFDLDVFGR